MGLTPEQNKVLLKRESEGDEFRTARGHMDIFSEDKDGNIQILEYTLNGWAITIIGKLKSPLLQNERCIFSN